MRGARLKESHSPVIGAFGFYSKLNRNVLNLCCKSKRNQSSIIGALGALLKSEYEHIESLFKIQKQIILRPLGLLELYQKVNRSIGNYGFLKRLNFLNIFGLEILKAVSISKD